MRGERRTAEAVAADPWAQLTRQHSPLVPQQKRKKKVQSFSVGLAFAQFLRFYPGSLYGWPQTRDGAIPWKAFWFLYSKVPALTALDRVNNSQATALGIGFALGSEKDRPKLKRALRREIKAAEIDVDEVDG